MTLQAGVGALHRLLRRERRRGLPIILMYHSISNPRSDAWGNAVSPTHFAQHLDILRRRRKILSLGQMVRRLAAGRSPSNAAVLTFDDGYSDNLHQAMPLLEHYDAPATVFTVTSAIDSPRAFWWNELEHLLLRPGSLPAHLCWETRAGLCGHDIGGAAHLTPAEANANAHWRGWQPPPTPRHALFHAIWRRLQHLPDDGRREFLDAIARWAGERGTGTLETRPLSSEELIRLSGCALMEIGAHTSTHASLPSLEPERRDAEIRSSKTFLENRIGREVQSFSYPHGDHDPATVMSVRAAGFQYACITGQAHVRRAPDLLRLPRIQVEDWDGETFERKLAQEFIA